MTVYFVDGNKGKDQNPGAAERPWKTLAKATKSVKAGDVVVIRAGTYYEQLVIKTPGTIWQAADGEAGQAILDGRYTPAERLPNGNMPPADAKKNYLPGSDYGKMVDIRADDVEVNGLTVRHVAGQPVGIYGNGVRVMNCTLDFAYGGGLVAENVKSPLVENVRLLRCNQKRYDPTNTKGGPANVQVNLLFKKVKNGVIRGCEVGYCHGEGIALAMESEGCVVEGNDVHTNLHMHIVINHAQNNTIRSNFVYHSNDPEFCQRGSGDPPAGLMISDELQRGAKHGLKRSAGNSIYNNIVVGMGMNFAARISKNAVGALRQTYVGHNTFVNARKNKGQAINVKIPPSAEHNGSFFENNIIIQNGGIAVKAPGGKGIAFRNNLWSSKPPAAASGPGDQVGDAALVNAGAPLLDGYGRDNTADPRHYQLTKRSKLAIGKAAENGVYGPLKDFFGHQRDAGGDIGAMVYDSEDVDAPEGPDIPDPPIEEEPPTTEPDPEPFDWREHFTADDLALIDSCVAYADNGLVGLPGHHLANLVARLVEFLDDPDE